jgi:hypothetical protein
VEKMIQEQRERESKRRIEGEQNSLGEEILGKTWGSGK